MVARLACELGVGVVTSITLVLAITRLEIFLLDRVSLAIKWHIARSAGIDQI